MANWYKDFGSFFLCGSGTGWGLGVLDGVVIEAFCRAAVIALFGLYRMGFLSANIAVCEAVLWEKTDVPTLVRVMSAINLGPNSQTVHFFVVTSLNSQPGDFGPHKLTVSVADMDGKTIAYTLPAEFKYGYKLDPDGPGGFIMTTEIVFDLSLIPLPVHLTVAAFLDSEPNPVSYAPLMLRRA